MKKNRFDIQYYITEGARSILTHGFMSFASVCMIVACLLIMGSFSLVAINLDKMMNQMEAENEFLAYIDDSVSDEDAPNLLTEILKVPNVASATYVTRDEAMESYKDKMGNDVIDTLPASVLRNRFRIHVTDIQQLDETLKNVENIDGIAKVKADTDMAHGLVTVRNIASGVALILIAILLVISLFIISNTIKLATFNRREEIAIMKMCGATNAFVRWPFIFEGLILGLMGAVTAFFLQWGVYTLIVRASASGDAIQLLTLVPYSQLAGTVLAIFAGTGFVIGVGGSLLAIRKFLQV